MEGWGGEMGPECLDPFAHCPCRFLCVKTPLSWHSLYEEHPGERRDTEVLSQHGKAVLERGLGLCLYARTRGACKDIRSLCQRLLFLINSEKNFRGFFHL